jgi:glycosyltransferase involved in cell wall biosynthesis
MTNTGREPTISVVICTFNRPEMLPRAIASVVAQDFRDLEIIVVDDGSGPAADVSAFEDDRIRVIRTKHRGVAAARAEALAAARGAFVAYCDDDDTWRRDHAGELLAYLTEHPEVDLVYADSEWIYEGEPPLISYSYDFDTFELSSWNYIFATDVMHRREPAKRAGGFDFSLAAHEDWDLWLRMSQDCVLRHLRKTLAAHYWHEGCLSEANLWYEWERVRARHQTRTEDDRLTGRGDAGEGVHRFNDDTWNGERRELVWHSPLRADVGYGSAARNLVLALDRTGIDVAIAPFGNQPVEGLERFFEPVNGWDRLGFYFDYRSRPQDMLCQHVVTYTMWEATRVPAGMVEAINRTSSLLYVPCKQNVASYLDSGVKVPVKVLHLGVDSRAFPFIPRERSDVFTFGTFGDLHVRKGIDVLIRAFRDEFRRHEPVRLILKSTDSLSAYAADDARIVPICAVMDQEQLLELLRQMHAFVLPSRGEGFGLCGLEAMSTGLPLIATNWSGPAEYLDNRDSFPLSYSLVQAAGAEVHGMKYFGQWAEPDYEHLRHLMRWVYEHPAQTADMGKLASARVHRDWTWDRVAEQAREELDELVSSLRDFHQRSRSPRGPGSKSPC